MNRDYVEQYVQLEKKHWWFRVRKKIIHQVIKQEIVTDSKRLRILNIGAAGGETSLLLQNFGDVVSVENDSFFFQFLCQKGFNVVKAEINSLPFEDEFFDLVCAFDVLEHVESDILALQEVIRVCKTDGCVCLTVPMYQFLWSRHDEINGHYRRYSTKLLKDLVVKSGTLENLYGSNFNGILFLPIFLIRKFSFLFRKKESMNSDFEFFRKASFFDKIFYFLFSIELKILKRTSLPFGVSYIGIFKKSKDPKANY